MLKSPVITNSTHQNSRADLNEIDTQEHQANVASSQISIVDTAPPRRSHTLSQLISKHFASTTNRPQRTPNDSSSMTADTVVPKRTLLAASDARSLPGNIRDYQGTATSFVSAKTEVIPFLAHTTDGNQFSRQLSRIDSVIELGSYNGDADLLGIQIDEAAENAQAHEEQKKNLLGMLNRYISSAGKLKESSKINNIKSDIALSPYLRETFTINKKGVISYIRSGGVNFDQIYNDFVYNHRKENGTFINNLNQFYKENLADVAMAGKRLVIKEKEALEDAHTAARSKATHQGGVHDLKIDLLRIKKKKEAFKDIYAENAVLVLQNPTLENYQSFEVAARGYATYLVEQDTKKVITAFEKDINSHSLNAAGANVLVGAGRKLGLVSAGQDAATYESNVKDLHKRAINDLDTVLKLAKGTAAPEVISAHMLTNMEHAINRAGDAFKAQRSEFRKEDKNIDLGKNPYVSDSPIYKTLRDRLGPICQSQSKEAVLNAVKNIITGVSDKHISAVANFDLSQKIKNSAHSSDNNAALLNQWATALAKGEKGLADEFLVNSLTKVEMEIRDHPDREWIVAQVKELQQQKISELVDQGFDTLIQSIDGLSEVNDLHGQLALIKADPKDTNKGKSIQAAIVEHRALSQVVERHLKKIIDDPTSTDAKRDSAQACLDRFEKNATVNKRRLDLEVNDALEQRGFFARYVDVISNWRYFIPIGTGVATALGLVVGGLVVGATVATGGIFLVVGGAVLGVVTVGAGLAITMKKANEIKFKEQRNLATTNELLTNPNLLEEKAKKKARFVANRIQLIPTTAKFALS
ncbi:MAG: hypothetical protein IT497_10655 [Ottowia sp.]|nr:hypothetical protein [Ottowia sp.]